jgi:hypothetical protein
MQATCEPVVNKSPCCGFTITTGDFMSVDRPEGAALTEARRTTMRSRKVFDRIDPKRMYAMSGFWETKCG